MRELRRVERTGAKSNSPVRIVSPVQKDLFVSLHDRPNPLLYKKEWKYDHFINIYLKCFRVIYLLIRFTAGHFGRRSFS